MCELRDFHNRLRIMLNLETLDLVEAGVLPRNGHGGIGFGMDPFRWFLRADDATAEKLWALIEKRAAGRPKTMDVPAPF